MREYATRMGKKKSRRRFKRDEEVVCYKELGCFRDSGPFDYLDMLPSPPEEIGTTFMFYGPTNKHLAQVIPYRPGPLDISRFNGSLPTKVIIHGFGSSCNRVWAHEMREALLFTLDCNVICVHWDKGAATPNYMRAAVNTRLVGRQVALLIKQLVNRHGASLDNIHLIGFSLGAHVSGFTGQELEGNISRITGLDPAGPLFEGYSTSARLDASDAQFVDVIHSNGDSLLRGGLGTWDQLGHVDFYPNGGRMQKGCTNLFLGAFSDLIWSGASQAEEGRSLCNHRRSYRFFIDSISANCTFPATPCDSYESLLAGDCFPCGPSSPCSQMGYYADRFSARGKLYLITREDEPFCANQHRVTVHGRGGPDGATYGRVEVTLISSSGYNETFPLTHSDGDDVSRPLVRMLVAHPVFHHINQVQLRYTAYNGWLYSGAPAWSIDKVAIVNSLGHSMSYCQRNMVLPDGKPVLLNLRAGNCRVSSFRPNQSFWKSPQKPPQLPPISLEETIPDPPPLEDVQSNHVRSLGAADGALQRLSSRPHPRRPAGDQAFFNPDGLPGRTGELDDQPPRPADHSKHRMEDESDGDQGEEYGDDEDYEYDEEESDNSTGHPDPPPTPETVAEGAKPVRGPDDLGVIVIRGVAGETGVEGRALSPARPSLAQLARVTNSSGEYPRRGRQIGIHGRARANATIAAAPRRPRPRRLRPGLRPQPAGPGPEPVYYVQYLPPELFERPAADYIPSRAVVPPPPGAGRAARSRGHRFGFLRSLFPTWESPETRYIPLTEGQRERFRPG
ncbi:pancreatic triacylglycerol lipase-like [Amphibalanus amphitrite]|uniref:pancreatic triacylglycerol lipase-like n=1 Tax=Amphibalanus amphitrite TaxID=1232801 RepID=UPI001C91A5C9|nr:pancreatic triacylglycerol lipase-like [Amphibalanus amphitrite]